MEEIHFVHLLVVTMLFDREISFADPPDHNIVYDGCLCISAPKSLLVRGLLFLAPSQGLGTRIGTMEFRRWLPLRPSLPRPMFQIEILRLSQT